MPEPALAAGLPAAGGDAGVVLGFDFGLRRIGVAIGNHLTRSARALRIIEAAGERRWAPLQAVIGEWQPRQLVVGVARHPDGAAHEMTRHCERFARQLAGRTGLPVAQVDERYTSAVLAPGRAGDDEAAALILQQWFDQGAAPC